MLDARGLFIKFRAEGCKYIQYSIQLCKYINDCCMRIDVLQVIEDSTDVLVMLLCIVHLNLCCLFIYLCLSSLSTSLELSCASTQ